MNELRDNLFRKAKSNIDDAQLRQKHNYDKKHTISKKKVMTCIIDPSGLNFAVTVVLHSGFSNDFVLAIITVCRF